MIDLCEDCSLIRCVVSAVCLSISLTIPSSEAKLGQDMVPKTMVESADHICTAVARDLRLAPSERNGARRVVCELRVENKMKGKFDSDIILLSMGQTTEKVLSDESRALLLKKRFLLFLKSVEGGYGVYDLVSSEGMLELTSVATEPETKRLDINDMVEAELVRSVKDDNVHIATAALDFLRNWGRKSELVSQTLTECTAATNKAPLYTQALVIRIEQGDYRALPLVLNVPADGQLQGEIRCVLATIRDPETIDGLINILESDSGLIRRGAMEALRSMADHENRKAKLKGVFEAALDDQDINVRYQALMGLGCIAYGHTGQRRQITSVPGTVIKTLPTYEDFQKDPDKYVKMWKPSQVPALENR